jgi:hypothetical protein
VLFCDLKNSTPIAEKLGPEAMHGLFNRFFELALQEVHRYEGTINQFLGDGFMALFGAPISHEDHARRAVLAAIGLQRALQESNPGEPYGVECAFRMGINTAVEQGTLQSVTRHHIFPRASLRASASAVETIMSRTFLVSFATLQRTA